VYDWTNITLLFFSKTLVQTIKVYLKGKKAAGEEKQQESKQQIWP
jgi:hypothetical protein